MININGYTLPTETLLLWRIRMIFVGLCLVSLALAFCSISVYLYTIPFLLLILCAFGTLWYLPRFFKSCKITVVGGTVMVEQGVFIKKTHILPFSRLIYTQTLSSPVAKALKLKAVTLKAARMRIFVPEMENDRVERFIAEISGGDCNK